MPSEQVAAVVVVVVLTRTRTATNNKGEENHDDKENCNSFQNDEDNDESGSLPPAAKFLTKKAMTVIQTSQQLERRAGCFGESQSRTIRYRHRALACTPKQGTPF